MDIREIAGQFIESVAKSPEHLKQLGVDPALAIKNATGLDLSDEEIADVAAAVGPVLEGKDIDMGKAMEAVGDFVDHGDILGKLAGLIGGK